MVGKISQAVPNHLPNSDREERYVQCPSRASATSFSHRTLYNSARRWLERARCNFWKFLSFVYLECRSSSSVFHQKWEKILQSSRRRVLGSQSRFKSG